MTKTSIERFLACAAGTEAKRPAIAMPSNRTFRSSRRVGAVKHQTKIPENNRALQGQTNALLWQLG